MKFTLNNADANQTRITNQCIELMTNFKASNGLLYIKSADREHINFIFQPSNKGCFAGVDKVDFDEEKGKAESEWFGHLLNMVKSEVGNNVESVTDNGSVMFTFNIKPEKKRHAKVRTA